MKNLSRIFLLTSMLSVGALGTLALTGCQRGPGEKLGRDIDRAAEDAGEAVEDAARETRRAVEDATD